MRRSLPFVLAAALAAGCSGGGGAAPPASSPPSSSSPPPSSPGAVAPLTGLPGRARPVIAVKVDNIPAALPQTGLDAADVVVEEPVEGGLTRLMAVFGSRDAAKVGPVRSARISDAELVRIFGGGGLAFSGASSSQLAVLRRERGVLLLTPNGAVWRRDRGRPAPHNLYLDERALRSRTGDLPGGGAAPFTFSAAVPAGGPARSVQLRWPAAAVAWTWAGGAWQRSRGGRPDLLAGGRRIGATNVVVLQVRSTSDPRFHDSNGQRTPLLDLVSGGPAWVLRDGRAVAGRWRHPAGGALQLLDGRGAVLPLRPGTTWVELLPAPVRPVLR
jgi:hypothetical protein